MSFVTRKVDCYLIGLPDGLEETGVECDVYWEANYCEKSWGISSIDITITEVRTQITWGIEDGYELEEIPLPDEFIGQEEVFDFVVDLKNEKWSINEDITVEEDGCCQPGSVEIDFRLKNIDIT